jgi:hypothetical protein
LLDAVGRCPPEDVGGAPGYADYLEATSDPMSLTSILQTIIRLGGSPKTAY